MDEQLAEATRAYLEGEVEIDRAGVGVVLPGLMKLYRADFGDPPQQVEFAAAHLPGDGDWLRERAPALRVRYARFDWTIVPS